MPTIALVHSPLVGPSSWAGVAEALERTGVDVVVPDVRHAAEVGGTVAAVVAAAVQQMPSSEVVLVGHSGSGVLLPLIAESAGVPVAQFVFVDAHLPPTEGTRPLVDEEFRKFLDELSTDGRLPQWSTWWGADAMAALVPDEAHRSELCEEMPQVPLSYFDEEVDAVSGWADRPCGYVRLSVLYEEQAATATKMGWPVERLSAGHLHAVVDPQAVSSAIRRVLGAL